MNKLKPNNSHSKWTWEKLETLLGIVPSQFPRYSNELLQEVVKVLGYTLPPSYIECVQRWGPGLAFGLFVIWQPASNANLDIRVKSPTVRNLVHLNIEMRLWDSNLTKFLEDLVPFGDSENGDILCWDPRGRLPNGEMPIYLLDNEQAVAPYVGSSLLSFFGEYCVDGKLDAVFPIGQGQKWNLPKNFDSY